jgi:large subunit ribosomal protein L4
LFRGGGRIFGPTPRSYNQKVNKKVKRLARKSALSIKAKEKAIYVLEDFNMDAPKTKQYSALLDSLGIAGKKTLHVLGESNKNVYLSSRNLEKSQVIINSELSTYGISNATCLVLSESSIAAIESLLNR